VPPKNGLRSNDLCHLFQGSSAQALADLGQVDAVGIGQPQAPFDLVPEDSVFRKR
jgi:hypothetical protein